MKRIPTTEITLITNGAVGNAVNGVENGVNDVIDGVENGINDTVDGIENGVNDTTGNSNTVTTTDAAR